MMQWYSKVKFWPLRHHHSWYPCSQKWLSSSALIITSLTICSCNIMYNESDKAIHFPLPQTDVPMFYKFLSHTHTHNHDRRISDDYTLRAPTSALRPKKSLKLFIKSFFVLELKKKRGSQKRGRKRGWEGGRSEERKAASFSSISPSPLLFISLFSSLVQHADGG